MTTENDANRKENEGQPQGEPVLDAAPGETEAQAGDQAGGAGQEPEKKVRYITKRKITLGVKPGYMLRKVGQAYMVLPTGPRMQDYQGMITLNETGAFLFKEAQKPEPTKEKLMEACRKEYGAEEEEARQAVDAFILQCAECGLFEYTTHYFDLVLGREVTEDELER